MRQCGPEVSGESIVSRCFFWEGITEECAVFRPCHRLNLLFRQWSDRHRREFADVTEALVPRGFAVGAGRGSRTLKTRSSADFEFSGAF